VPSLQDYAGAAAPLEEQAQEEGALGPEAQRRIQEMEAKLQEASEDLAATKRRFTEALKEKQAVDGERKVTHGEPKKAHDRAAAASQANQEAGAAALGQFQVQVSGSLPSPPLPCFS